MSKNSNVSNNNTKRPSFMAGFDESMANFKNEVEVFSKQAKNTSSFMADFNSKDAPTAQDVTLLPPQNLDEHRKEVIKIMGESAHLFLPNDH